MKRIKAGNVMMCEFIAQGAYSKHTLVNTYSGDITVQTFPATFALAFFIEIIPEETTPSEIRIQIKQGKNVVGELVANFEFESGKSVIITTPPLALTFEGPEKVQVVASATGVKPSILATKQVNAGHIPGLN